MGFVGLMGWGGGLSDYVCVDAKFAFKLPDSISTEVGGELMPNGNMQCRCEGYANQA